ncbi:uncharacterized protein PG986_014861 [Apiospora aurea]|uniref:Uncharacterized protein n=1 Tax=Apiospora aurea TaxID=335848 RepID=A0ABR1PU89_9PEZI
MASSSVASSPVLFDSPPPGLKPAPLRIPDRKSKGSDDANDREFWGTYEHHASPNSEEVPVTPPSNRVHPGSLSHRRVPSNKLDSLVSKFEILDAVNNADEEVPWLPQHPKNKPDAEPDSRHLPPPEASTVPRRALEHSTSSHEKTSTAEDSSDISPLTTRPGIPVRRSNLPPIADSRTTTNINDPAPATPPKQTYNLAENSAFKSPKSLLDPAAFRVSQPDVKLVGTSPRRLPTSRSAKKASPIRTKSPRSFRSAIASLCGPSASSEEALDLMKAHVVERDPETRTGCAGKPSVADLRKSFEQKSHVNGSQALQQTPTKGRRSMNVSVQQSGSSNREKSISADSGPAMKMVTSEVSAQESSKTLNTPPSARHRSQPELLKQQPADGFLRTPTYSARVLRTPVTGIPTSKGSRQRQAMLTKSKTMELSSVTSCSTKGPDDPGAWVAAETVKAKKVQLPFPLLDHVCVTHKSDDENVLLCCGDGQPPHVQAKQISHRQQAATSSSEGSNVFNTTFTQAIPVEVRPISRPNSKSDPTTRRTAKVADLRRLFDRPSLRGSSPTGFMTFARRQRSTMPSLGSGDATRNHDLAEYTTSSNESAPELTTEISLNDFSCRFSHDQNPTNPCEGAPLATTAGKETRMSSSKPRAHFHMLEDTETETERKDSPLKRRIKHFEHLQVSSNPKGLAYGRAKSHDANLHAAFKASSPRRVPSKVKNGQWLRERGASTWRRISSSLNISTDGGNDTSNVLYRGRSDLETSLSTHRDNSFGFSLQRMSTPFHLSLADPHNTPTHYREYSSEASHEAMIAELKSHSSYLSHARPSPSARTPKHLLPLYAARKSRAAIKRFTSGSNRSSEGYNIGLDGFVESKPSRDGDVQLFSNPNHNIESEDLQMHPSPSNEGAPLAPVSTLPTSEQLAKKTVKDAKKASKEKERESKAAAKAAAKESKARDKGKQGRRFVSLGSSHKNARGRKPTPHPNTLEVGSQSEADGGSSGRKKKQMERSWGKITASGFMVRQAKVDELHQPKPQRPGQVKKIVNMYKEKSTSLLRIVSGNQSSHSHVGGGGGGGRHGTAAGSSSRKKRGIGNTDGEGDSTPRSNPDNEDEKANGSGHGGGGKYM